MDWTKPCAYDEDHKQLWHRAVRSQLQRLAWLLQWDEEAYDLRSNKGGIAVSGEVNLHHDQVYVQVAQSAMGDDNGILIRACSGRNDYRGGLNNFFPLALLDDLETLADKIHSVMHNRRA